MSPIHLSDFASISKEYYKNEPVGHRALRLGAETLKGAAVACVTVAALPQATVWMINQIGLKAIGYLALCVLTGGALHNSKIEFDRSCVAYGSIALGMLSTSATLAGVAPAGFFVFMALNWSGSMMICCSEFLQFYIRSSPQCALAALKSDSQSLQRKGIAILEKGDSVSQFLAIDTALSSKHKSCRVLGLDLLKKLTHVSDEFAKKLFLVSTSHSKRTEWNISSCLLRVSETNHSIPVVAYCFKQLEERETNDEVRTCMRTLFLFVERKIGLSEIFDGAARAIQSEHFSVREKGFQIYNQFISKTALYRAEIATKLGAFLQRATLDKSNDIDASSLKYHLEQYSRSDYSIDLTVNLFENGNDGWILEALQVVLDPFSKVLKLADIASLLPFLDTLLSKALCLRALSIIPAGKKEDLLKHEREILFILEKLQERVTDIPIWLVQSSLAYLVKIEEFQRDAAIVTGAFAKANIHKRDEHFKACQLLTSMTKADKAWDPIGETLLHLLANLAPSGDILFILKELFKALYVEGCTNQAMVAASKILASVAFREAFFFLEDRIERGECFEEVVEVAVNGFRSENSSRVRLSGCLFLALLKKGYAFDDVKKAISDRINLLPDEHKVTTILLCSLIEHREENSLVKSMLIKLTENELYESRDILLAALIINGYSIPFQFEESLDFLRARYRKTTKNLFEYAFRHFSPEEIFSFAKENNFLDSLSIYELQKGSFLLGRPLPREVRLGTLPAKLFDRLNTKLRIEGIRQSLKYLEFMAPEIKEQLEREFKEPTEELAQIQREIESADRLRACYPTFRLLSCSTSFSYTKQDLNYLSSKPFGSISPEFWTSMSGTRLRGYFREYGIPKSQAIAEHEKGHVGSAYFHLEEERWLATLFEERAGNKEVSEKLDQLEKDLASCSEGDETYIPEHFFCPYTKKIMRNPVNFKNDCRTYDMTCTYHSSAREFVDERSSTPNIRLKAAIEKFVNIHSKQSHFISRSDVLKLKWKP